LQTILNNLVYIDSDMFFKPSSTRHTRGNSMKLSKCDCHTVSATDSHFFTNHVVNVWNSLSEHTVTFVLNTDYSYIISVYEIFFLG